MKINSNSLYTTLALLIIPIISNRCNSEDFAKLKGVYYDPKLGTFTGDRVEIALNDLPEGSRVRERPGGHRGHRGGGNHKGYYGNRLTVDYVPEGENFVVVNVYCA
jgi:hypothetical protein